MTVRAGAALIVISLLCWVAVPFVPIARLGAGATAAIVAGLVVLAEVVFWIGVVLVGRETWQLARGQGWRQVPGALWAMLRHGRRPTSTG